MAFTSQQIRALAILLAVATVSYIDRNVLSILQVPIKTEMGFSDAQIGALIGLAFSIPYMVFALPLGRWADVDSRKRVLLVILSIWSCATALNSLAVGFVTLMMLRMGMAVGEAGCLPASYSLLADYFPLRQRGRAIAIYGMAYSIGTMIGLAGGGFLAAALGWRRSFLIVGLLGLALVPVIVFGLKEPARTTPSGVVAEKAPAIMESIRLLWGVTAFRYLVGATSFAAYTNFVMLSWSAPFFVRVHGLSLSKVALLLGVMIGLGGALGNFLAGLAADRLSNRDMRWYLWVPAIGCLLSIPVVLLELNVASAGVAMGLAFLTAVLTNAFVPPTYALTQSLVHPRLRALGSSVIATGCNIVGGSLGPLVTGLISDTLLTHYRLGPDSLRYALCFSVVGMVVAVFLYLASAQSLLNRQKEGEPSLVV